MKELYISPEVELIGFVAQERLASNFVDFDTLDQDNKFNGFGKDLEASQDGNDICLPFNGL